MKLSLVFFLVFIPASAFAQLPTNERGEVEYSEVVTVDSVDQKTLFNRSKLFVANAFVSVKDVTNLDDSETFTVITKGDIPWYYTNGLGSTPGGAVRFKFTIQCKDGRYKYSVSNFVHTDVRRNGNYSGGAFENEKASCGGLLMPKKTWNKIKSDTNESVLQFIADLKKTMAGSAAAHDNW